MDRIGHERAGDAALDVALGAVVEQRPGDLDAGGGVRDVVGSTCLLVVGLRRGREATSGLLDHAVGEVDDGRGSREVGSGHATEASEGRSCRSDR